MLVLLTVLIDLVILRFYVVLHRCYSVVSALFYRAVAGTWAGTADISLGVLRGSIERSFGLLVASFFCRDDLLSFENS